MKYFLGIDGGGTRTTAWLSDDKGRVLARAAAGPSNPLKVGFDATQREILRAARDVLRQAHVAVRLGGRRRRTATGRGAAAVALDAVCVGLAGTDWPPVRRKVLAWLRKAIPAHHYLLTSDAAIALRAAIADSPGVTVISGTGSIAYGRDDRGRVLRSGGWGAVFDDAGSGYDLGRKAVAAALRDYDGRGPYTQLTTKICRALQIPEITHVVLKNPSPSEVAALFPLVLEAARRRDAVARQLCDEAGKNLAELALALLRRLGWMRRVIPVVFAGGVFRSSLRIRRAVTRQVRRHAPQARVLLLRHPPVEGALAIARDLIASE